MELDLNNTEWDCCVVGNGVSALWVSHWLWSSKKSVLWITSDEPYSSERAMLQHAWLWGISAENANLLTSQLQGFDAQESHSPFEAIYFDAKSAKRFRKFGEVKNDWGAHEKGFFQALADSQVARDAAQPQTGFDLWPWHSRLHAFHEAGSGQGPTQIELFRDPRFVRVQGWPVLELKTTSGRLSGVILAGMKPEESIEIRADKFYLGDFDEPLAPLVKDEESSQALSNALKGKSFRAGFGLRLWHSDLPGALTQTAVIPLVVNPEKGAGSHIVGRFERTQKGLESYWVGFLTDEEIEDNNEILKKIKLAKRAIDRAIPGFVDSVQREAVNFEPRMRAEELVKNRKTESLGSVLISDHYGAEAAAEAVKKIFSAGVTTSKRKDRTVSASDENTPEV